MGPVTVLDRAAAGVPHAFDTGAGAAGDGSAHLPSASANPGAPGYVLIHYWRRTLRTAGARRYAQSRIQQRAHWLK